jgi:hypothetical protein
MSPYTAKLSVRLVVWQFLKKEEASEKSKKFAISRGTYSGDGL